MLIGIVSDTHNDQDAFQKAIKEFNKQKVETVFHCGDWSSFSMLKLCEKLNCPVFSVFGNNDNELFEFEKESVGNVSFGGKSLEKKLTGRKIAICHGDSISLLDSLLSCGKYDVVFSGHTHIELIQKIGSTLHVNPGSPAYSRNRPPSVAIYNSETGTARLVIL